MKQVLPFTALALVAAACGGGSTSEQRLKIATAPAAAPIVRAQLTPVPTPPPQLCLVTRERGVPESYVPPDLAALPRDYTLGPNIRLRAEAARAAIKLIDAAWEEGHKILAESGYRSFQEQFKLVSDVAKRVGVDQAQRQVAPAGHSEHQLGLAMDVGIVRKPFSDDPAFGTWPEGLWLAANAHRFGYLISYPLGKEEITGYAYEPWHIRYVGTPLAEQIHTSGQTLTEYLTANGMAGCEAEARTQ
jgi:D-alanyl-D-alanine carboxypeptidase